MHSIEITNKETCQIRNRLIRTCEVRFELANEPKTCACLGIREKRAEGFCEKKGERRTCDVINRKEVKSKHVKEKKNENDNLKETQ